MGRTEISASQFGVKSQGHGGITYVGTVTAPVEAYSRLLDVSCRVRLSSLRRLLYLLL